MTPAPRIPLPHRDRRLDDALHHAGRLPLVVHAILRHLEALHAPVELAVFDGSTVARTTYGAVLGRVRRLAGGPAAAGVKAGDRVGSFMWNTQPHLEAYLAVPAMGAVLHTIDIRLFPDQVAHLINEVENEVLLVDASSLWDGLAPVLEQTPHGSADHPYRRRRPSHGARCHHCPRGRLPGADRPE